MESNPLASTKIRSSQGSGIRSGPHLLSGHPLASDDSPEEDHGDDEPIREDDGSGKELTPEDLVEMPAWKRFIFSKWGCAVLLTLLTIVLLLIIRPAFFLKKRDNLLEKPRVNWLVVFITSIVLFAAFAGIPALVVYCKKKWVGKT